VYSRRHARQPTRCDEGTRSVRDGFGGGRCGGAAPAQGRAEGPTAKNIPVRGERTPLLASFRGANQFRLSSCAEFMGCALTFRSLDTLPTSGIINDIFLSICSNVCDNIYIQRVYGVEKSSFLPQLLDCWRIDQWYKGNAFSKLRV